ncbi:MAG TPA: PfkB family carbohydrate kinase [Candidatus Eisenbacteria bacterium]|nr:PfkB family carbohydrate kinase [Candidatus Eisenbacteria bacterium]
MKLLRARPPAPDRLVRWVERLKDGVAVVWGDFVLDEYWRCLSRRVSREAPVLILEYLGRSTQGGGAANAALNLAALGMTTRAVGFVGQDPAGRELTEMLSKAGVDCAGLIPLRRASTVVKTRVVAGSVHTALQQVVRVDRGRPFTLDAASRRRLDGALRSAEREARVVLLSDYGYDSVTPALAAPRIRRWRARRVTVALDARYRITDYRGVTLATPNESEASAAAGLAVADDRDLAAVASRLQERMRAAHLVITRGRDGLTVWGRSSGQSLGAFGGHEAVDVTGAGDAVVAVSAAALSAGASALEAAALANVAGAIAVSRRGAVAVSGGDLERALRTGASRRATKVRS